MSACFSSLENFEKRIESLMSSNVNFAKKSAFFVSRLVLISSFRVAFFISRLWKDFWLLRCQFNWTYWELFLALINLVLGRSLYLQSILKIGSYFDESEHLISSFCAAFFVSRLWKDFWLLRCQFNWTYWELFLALINLVLGRSLYLQSILKIGSYFDESEHLISSFCAAFFVSRLWKDFWLLQRQFNWTYWELFLALINLILGRSLYLSSIFKIGSCFDESEHLYPLLAIYIQNGMKTIKFVWKSISKFSSFSFAPPRFNRFCLRCSP